MRYPMGLAMAELGRKASVDPRRPVESPRAWGWRRLCCLIWAISGSSVSPHSAWPRTCFSHSVLQSATTAMEQSMALDLLVARTSLSVPKLTSFIKNFVCRRSKQSMS
jgi:hypothetical protein